MLSSFSCHKYDQGLTASFESKHIVEQLYFFLLLFCPPLSLSLSLSLSRAVLLKLRLHSRFLIIECCMDLEIRNDEVINYVSEWSLGVIIV
jgi:hypothetical protein